MVCQTECWVRDIRIKQYACMPSNTIEWGPSRLTRRFLWLFIGFMLVMGAVFVAAGSADGPTGLMLGLGVAVLLAGLPAFVALRAIRRLRIVDDGTDLVLVSLMSVRRIPWSDVVGATPGYAGITVLLRSGDTALSGAVQKSNIAAWLHRSTRADEVADYIGQRAGG